MRQVMRVQDALQDRARTGYANLCELGAQEVDGAAVERLERVSARNGALFHERFLDCEERRVELALGWGERAVYGEGKCCVNGWMINMSEPGTALTAWMRWEGNCLQMSEA